MSNEGHATEQPTTHTQHEGHQVGSHILWDVGGTTLHGDTLITSWLVIAVLAILAISFSKKLTQKPGKGQVFIESAVEFVEDLVTGQIETKNTLMYMPLIGTIFFFVLFSNLIGLVPWRILALFGFQGELASPTNDLNTTGALALIALVSYFYYGIKKKGWGYFKHYITPHPAFFPLNLMEDFTRPLSLAFRLFGNIMGGEIVLFVLLGLAPWFIPLPLFALEVFVAFIQAFIFAVLTAFYIGAAVAEHH